MPVSDDSLVCNALLQQTFVHPARWTAVRMYRNLLTKPISCMRKSSFFLSFLTVARAFACGCCREWPWDLKVKRSKAHSRICPSICKQYPYHCMAKTRTVVFQFYSLQMSTED